MRCLALSMMLTIAAVGLVACAAPQPRPHWRATLSVTVTSPSYTVIHRVEAQSVDPWKVDLMELERLIRERESAGIFSAEVTAWRVVLECRKAGMTKEK